MFEFIFQVLLKKNNIKQPLKDVLAGIRRVKNCGNKI